ncbi:putative ferric-chelate reductase 1 [Pelmatolapia mariae]|uniref:putative ferric-chelate reductase 1 n=1 Tax=Pelmatolapia mariae TaxID=158779 RepID=UPI002FE6C492
MALPVLLLLCAAPLVRGHGSGLVIDSCKDMQLHHSGLSPQTAPSPFTVTTEQSRYGLGEDVIVELQGPASTPFTGFLLEARELGSKSPVGSFAIPEGAAQLLTCSQRAKSAGSISSADCGVTKVCFSQPSNCDPAVSSSCYFMSAKMLAGGEAVHFEMTGPYEGYIAFGFSDDQRMGNDDIYVCVMKTNGQVEVEHMYSTGRSKPQVLPLGNVYNITTSLQNSVISCVFTTTNIISIEGTSGFNQSYYLLFAYGPTNNGSIRIHMGTFTSNKRIDINNPLVVGKGDVPDIIKAHGSLMLIAWMTTGSLGMMVARYLKKMAKGKKMCDKDLWFMVHVGVMCLTVAATITAFILVFAHAQDWSGGAHPVLGCLVMILSLIQPIGALLRCGPQHHLRYLFNWTHFLNAVVIKSIAVAAIFTGLDRIDSDDGWLMKVMGGFFAWEVLFIIILEVHDWIVKHRDGTADQMESALVKGDSCLIAAYLLGNLCFLVALLAGIGEK